MKELLRFSMRYVVMVGIIFTVFIALLIVPVVSYGQEQEILAAAEQEDYSTYIRNSRRYKLGVIGYDREERRYYCIEQPNQTDFIVKNVIPVPDSTQSRQIAALLQKYQTSHNDDYTQSALAIIVHDAFDTSTGTDGWPANRAMLEKNEKIMTRVAELLAEAPLLVPDSMRMEMSYDEKQASGEIHVHIRNANGQQVEGVPFTLTLDGPAVFDYNDHEISDRDTTISSISTGEPFTIRWHATGDGQVRLQGSSTVPSVERIESAQDLIRIGGGISVALNELAFEAHSLFEPLIETEVSSKSIDPGSPVVDLVTLQVEDTSWPEDVVLQADGWYFDGLTVDDLTNSLMPETNEEAIHFLERIQQQGYEPNAYAHASFDHSEQTVEAQAMSLQETDELYASTGGFGTWVWAVQQDKQQEIVRSKLTHDVVTTFLDPEETQITRVPLTITSQVVSDTAYVGDEISDIIQVSGFPQDHGSFEQAQSWGFLDDEISAEVRVWWAGDGTGGDDAVFAPSSSEEPQEDDNHHLVGVWRYHATNGTIQVGGGAADTRGEAVSIQAERPGFYVFVWSFAGDNRVMPITSSYADSLECVRVIENPERIDKNEEPLAQTGSNSEIVALVIGVLVLAAAVVLVIRRHYNPQSNVLHDISRY